MEEIKINKDKIPVHIAIIMDGNGRWAKKRGFDRIFGHRSALRAIREIVESCVELKVKYLTLYTFSSENWQRPQSEVEALMDLLLSSLNKELDTFLKNGVKFNFIGDLRKISDKIVKNMNIIKDKTRRGENTMLTLAVDYGSKNEILNATKEIAIKLKKGEINEEDITEELFRNSLYTKGMDDVDLVIRTGKEKRISNFLLWQCAYSEFYFSDILWPDFTGKDLCDAILNYQKRDRRFGKVSS